ncbi:hypothetical protein T439DRAFT_357023 [Meredithblackwellia eburnea MCA 4105]
MNHQRSTSWSHIPSPSSSRPSSPSFSSPGRRSRSSSPSPYNTPITPPYRGDPPLSSNSIFSPQIVRRSSIVWTGSGVGPRLSPHGSLTRSSSPYSSPSRDSFLKEQNLRRIKIRQIEDSIPQLRKYINSLRTCLQNPHLSSLSAGAMREKLVVAEHSLRQQVDLLTALSKKTIHSADAPAPLPLPLTPPGETHSSLFPSRAPPLLPSTIGSKNSHHHQQQPVPILVGTAHPGRPFEPITKIRASASSSGGTRTVAEQMLVIHQRLNVLALQHGGDAVVGCAYEKDEHGSLFAKAVVVRFPPLVQ